MLSHCLFNNTVMEMSQKTVRKVLCSHLQWDRLSLSQQTSATSCLPWWDAGPLQGGSLSLPGYLTLERRGPGSPSTAHLVRTEQARKQLNFCTSWRNSFPVSPFPVKRLLSSRGEQERRAYRFSLPSASTCCKCLGESRLSQCLGCRL